jgi:hypothetical protein
MKCLGFLNSPIIPHHESDSSLPFLHNLFLKYQVLLPKCFNARHPKQILATFLLSPCVRLDPNISFCLITIDLTDDRKLKSQADKISLNVL